MTTESYGLKGINLDQFNECLPLADMSAQKAVLLDITVLTHSPDYDDLSDWLKELLKQGTEVNAELLYLYLDE